MKPGAKTECSVPAIQQQIRCFDDFSSDDEDLLGKSPYKNAVVTGRHDARPVPTCKREDFCLMAKTSNQTRPNSLPRWVIMRYRGGLREASTERCGTAQTRDKSMLNGPQARPSLIHAAIFTSSIEFVARSTSGQVGDGAKNCGGAAAPFYVTQIPKFQIPDPKDSDPKVLRDSDPKDPKDP
ncbi:hypothetical protein MRX96_030669 [Rhipicephalus microplus]